MSDFWNDTNEGPEILELEGTREYQGKFDNQKIFSLNMELGKTYKNSGDLYICSTNAIACDASQLCAMANIVIIDDQIKITDHSTLTNVSSKIPFRSVDYALRVIHDTCLFGADVYLWTPNQVVLEEIKKRWSSYKTLDNMESVKNVRPVENATIYGSFHITSEVVYREIISRSLNIKGGVTFNMEGNTVVLNLRENLGVKCRYAQCLNASDSLAIEGKTGNLMTMTPSLKEDVLTGFIGSISISGKLFTVLNRTKALPL